MAGPGGVIAVMLMRKFGRLPVLFWSQVRRVILPHNHVKTQYQSGSCHGISRWRYFRTHSQYFRRYVQPRLKFYFMARLTDTSFPQAFRCLTAFFGTCPQVTVWTGSAMDTTAHLKLCRVFTWSLIFIHSTCKLER
jgi:hypothetical protein